VVDNLNVGLRDNANVDTPMLSSVHPVVNQGVIGRHQWSL